jgi:hypothetical protein
MTKRKAAIAAAGSLCATLLLAELSARVLLGYTPLTYSRPYDPVFVSGDFGANRSRREMERASDGPAALGYSPDAFGDYFWNGKPARSSTTLSDFLFAHYLSRYHSDAVDHIICTEPDSIDLYVLGGSVAVGSSASSPGTSWHAVLEGMLRSDLKRKDLYVFNAAMGAFVSFQERLAYELAVVPRAGHFVLIVDGYNDLLLPASTGSRPGDPFQLGTRFDQFYGSYLVMWIAEHSALVNKALDSARVRSVEAYRRRLTQDQDAFEEYANSAVNLYLENISAILRDCDARGAVCLVGIQPSLALSESYLGKPKPDADILPPNQVCRLYEILFKKLSASKYADRFIDLTHIFPQETDLRDYTDSVHLNDDGQRVLAAAVLPRVEAMLKSAASSAAGGKLSGSLASRCEQVMPN